MALASSLSSEQSTSEGNTDLPAFRGMIDDLSTALSVPPSTIDGTSENLRIDQALVLPHPAESDEAAGGTSSASNAEIPAEETTNPLLDAINSTSKQLSSVLNNKTSSTSTVLEEQSADASVERETALQTTSTVQPCVAPPSPAQVPTTTTTTTGSLLQSPKKKQHIMISYHRSSEEICRKIRNDLRGLKYKVWMDVYDMRDNFIDGMATAIANSYIILMCINKEFEKSQWCRKETEGAAIKGIKLIPCFLEKPFATVDWLTFIMGANHRVDFSQPNNFNEKFGELIDEIKFIEEKLAIYPRESPPITPAPNPLSTDAPMLTVIPDPNIATRADVDTIMRNFKNWIEENRHDLKRLKRKESTQLINQVLRELNHLSTSDDENENELLRELLSTPTEDRNEVLLRFFDSLTALKHTVIKLLLIIMSLWAVKTVFKES